MKTAELSTRKRNAYLRMGVDEAESRRAWVALRAKAAAVGHEGDIWFHQIVKAGGRYLFIAHTAEGWGVDRYFAVEVKPIVESSTLGSRSRILWHLSRIHGIPTPAYHRCCGNFRPHGHTITCLERFR